MAAHPAHPRAGHRRRPHGRPASPAWPRLFEVLGRARQRARDRPGRLRTQHLRWPSTPPTRPLRAAHAGFWLSAQTIALGVIGPGKVGAALLDQLPGRLPRLKREANIDPGPRGIASSAHVALRAGRRQRLARRSAGPGDPSDPPPLPRTWKPRTCRTPSSSTAAPATPWPAHYADWLAAGIHVITPTNGRAPDRWRATPPSAPPVRPAVRAFAYEATVGADCPSSPPLRDLLDTGDELQAVDGIFSGTLAWLFNRYDGSTPFSALVRGRTRWGYTEPDPRDDLSGTDVARKLVILARGWPRAEPRRGRRGEPGAARAARGPSARTSSRPGRTDAPMAARLAAARARGQVLRYVAHFDAAGAASVPDGAAATTPLPTCASPTTWCNSAPLQRQSAHRAGPGAGRGDRRRVFADQRRGWHAGSQAVSRDQASAFLPRLRRQHRRGF